MHEKSPFEQLVSQLLAGAPNRNEAHDLSLARPLQPAPLLLQGGDAMVAVAIGLELMAALGRHGGGGSPSSVTEPIREAIRARFGASAWAHIEEELAQVLDWLQLVLTTERTDTPDESLVFDVTTRRAAVVQALEQERDLFIEFLRVDEQGRSLLFRARIRPDAIEDRPGPAGKEELVPCVVGRRVPDAEPMTVALEQIRWLMLVHRFSPLRETELARVLRFTPQPDGEE